MIEKRLWWVLKHLQEGEYQTNERAIGYNSNENKCVFSHHVKLKLLRILHKKLTEIMVNKIRNIQIIV